MPSQLRQQLKHGGDKEPLIRPPQEGCSSRHGAAGAEPAAAHVQLALQPGQLVLVACLELDERRLLHFDDGRGRPPVPVRFLSRSSQV